jgi:hypothetical protein
MRLPADGGFLRPAPDGGLPGCAYSRTSTTSFRSSRCAGLKVIWS